VSGAGTAVQLAFSTAVALCDRDCRAVNFFNNQLAGTIPESLGALTGVK
jgi:hypothetical protein